MNTCFEIGIEIYRLFCVNGKSEKKDGIAIPIERANEGQKIIDAVNKQINEDGFSVVKVFDEVKAGKYSFNPGSYFNVNIDYAEMTAEKNIRDCLGFCASRSQFFHAPERAVFPAAGTPNNSRNIFPYCRGKIFSYKPLNITHRVCYTV